MHISKDLIYTIVTALVIAAEVLLLTIVLSIVASYFKNKGGK